MLQWSQWHRHWSLCNGSSGPVCGQRRDWGSPSRARVGCCHRHLGCQARIPASQGCVLPAVLTLLSLSLRSPLLKGLHAAALHLAEPSCLCLMSWAAMCVWPLLCLAVQACPFLHFPKGLSRRGRLPCPPRLLWWSRRVRGQARGQAWGLLLEVRAMPRDHAYA